MTLINIAIGFFGFIIIWLVLQIALPGFQKQKLYAKRAQEILLSEMQLVRKKDGAMITFVTDKLLPTVEKKFTLDQILGLSLRKEYDLLQFNVSYEHRIARMVVKSLVATFPLLFLGGVLMLLPVPINKGAIFIVSPIFFTVVFLAQIQEIKKEYKKRQTEITKDLPLLIDKMVIALEAGRPFIETIQEVEKSSGPRMKSMLKKLSADMRFKKPEEAIEAFAKSTGLQVMTNFSVAVKIGLNNGFDEAMSHFEDIKEDINELHKVRLEETTKNKPNGMYGLYALLIGHAFVAFLIAAVYIFSQFNEII